MINKNIIEDVKKIIISEYNPIEIYLFGSYAWGNPDIESDLDILIVIDKFNKAPYETLVDIHKSLMSLNIPKDILVLTKEDFDKKAKHIFTLSYKIKNEGKRIYAKA